MFFSNDTALRLLLLLLLFFQKEKKTLTRSVIMLLFILSFTILFRKAKCAILKCVAPFGGEKHDLISHRKVKKKRQKQSYDDFRQMMTIIILTIPCSG